MTMRLSSLIVMAYVRLYVVVIHFIMIKLLEFDTNIYIKIFV